jgi:hypothetical protein
MNGARLPVSGTVVVFRAPNGADDVFLAEQSACDASVAVELLARVATAPDGSLIDWASLPVTDVDAGLLALRRTLLGEVVRAAVRCTAAECGALFDVSFRISDYLRHHLPRKARTSNGDEPGWFRLDRTETFFRLPTACDVIALTGETDVEGALAARCIRPDASSKVRRRVETAMQALAPSLYDELDCVCHECGASVPLVFNPVRFVLGELAGRAAHIYDDVHLLASRYHWTENDILALPQARRARYAELAHGEGAH